MTTAVTFPIASIEPGIPDGRLQRAMKTWLMIGLQTTLTMTLAIFTTPLIIRYLGVERVGAQKASNDWLGYLTLSDLGLGGAFGVMILRARATQTPAAIAAITRQGLRVLGGLALVCIPIGLFLAWLMPKLVRAGPELQWELRVACMISVISVAAAPLAIFRTVLDVSQRGYLVSTALLVQSLLIVGLSVLLAYQGHGLIGQSIASLIGISVFYSLIIYWALREIGATTAVQAATTTWRELWRLAWPLGVSSAGNRLNLMTDTIVIGLLLGPKPVAAMFLTQRLILIANAQINSVANASWAALADLKHRAENVAFRERLVELSRLVVGVGLTISGTVAAYDGQFVKLWVGKTLYAGDLLAVLTLLQGVVFGFVLLFTWVIDTLGDGRHRTVVSSSGSVLNLILSFAFVKWIGLPGVTLGTIVAYLMTDVWYCPFIAVRRYGVPMGLLCRGLARGFAFGGAWAVFAWLVSHSHIPPHRWVGFISEALIMGSASLAYCWLIVLTAAERAIWSQRLRRAK